MPAEPHNDCWTLLKSGDQEALLQLYREHYVGLMNYGVRICRDRTVTADCISQILLRLWDTRHKLPEVSNVRSYLLSCLRNEILGELRRSSRIRAEDASADVQEESFEVVLVAMQEFEERRAQVTQLLSELTPREKELLRLRYFENLDYDIIAEQCGITKRTVYNIVHNALKTLKARMSAVKARSLRIPLLLVALFFW